MGFRLAASLLAARGPGYGLVAGPAARGWFGWRLLRATMASGTRVVGVGIGPGASVRGFAAGLVGGAASGGLSRHGNEKVGQRAGVA